MADEDGEVVVTPLFQDVVEVVVVATLVVDNDVLRDFVRADDNQVVDGVDELLNFLVVDAVALVAELFVVALSDADLDVSSLVDILVDSLSLMMCSLMLISMSVISSTLLLSISMSLLSISLLLNSISMLLLISLLLTDVMVLLHSLLCLLLSC